MTDQPMKKSDISRPAHCPDLAAVLAIALLILVAVFYWRFVFARKFQVDFSAYYSATSLMARGGNPYYDFLSSRDGVLFKHSQYLQPPVTACFFLPLALLDYATAKTAYYFLQVAVLTAILVYIFGSLRRALWINLAVFALMPWLAWPLYTHFERGQTDLWVLLFIVLSYFSWKRDRSLAAGIWLGLAGLFKLPALFLFIIPLVFKDRRFLAGGLLAAGLLMAISSWMGGFDLHRAYFLEYLPAISRTGSLPPDMDTAAPLQTGFQQNKFVWEGKEYTVARSLQAGSGTLTGFLREQFSPIASLLLGLVGLVATFLMIIFVQRRNQSSGMEWASRNCAWAAAMLAILVFHPLTWVMAYVWLAMLIPLCLTVRRALASDMTTRLVYIAEGIALLMILIGDPITSVGIGLTVKFPIITASVVWIAANRVWIGGTTLWLAALYLTAKMAEPSIWPLMGSSMNVLNARREQSTK
jgi:hypothetical protein